MTKKVYEHNDYYGYINKVQEKAISNPQWFWSDAQDATEARQWLYNNNAGAIVDEIYENTPEDVKKNISPKKLSNELYSKVINDKARQKTNDAAKVVGTTLAASFAAPGAIASSANLLYTAPETLPKVIDWGKKVKAGLNWGKVAKEATRFGVGTAEALGAEALSNKLYANSHEGVTLNEAIGEGINTTLHPTQGKVATTKATRKADSELGAWFNPVTWLTGGLGSTVVELPDKLILRKAFKDGRLKFVGPKTFKGIHHSFVPVYKPDFSVRRWDVVNHGADPKGMWFNLDKAIDEGFMAERPFTSNWKIKSKNALQQTGEINSFWGTKNSMRNNIVALARKKGADAVAFKDIADNTLKHQNVLFATDKAKIKLKGHNYYDSFKPVNNEQLADAIKAGITSEVIANAYKKNHNLVPKEFGDFVQNSVDKQGNVNKEDVIQAYEEIYKMFDKMNIPYTKATDIHGQRYTKNGVQKSTGNLLDHSFSAAKTLQTVGLPKNNKHVNIHDQALLDLYHDIGKIVDVNKDTHAKYSYDISGFLKFPQTWRNALKGHMGKKFDPYGKVIDIESPSKDYMHWFLRRDDLINGRTLEDLAEKPQSSAIKHFIKGSEELKPLVDTDEVLLAGDTFNTNKALAKAEAYKNARGFSQQEALIKMYQTGELDGHAMMRDAYNNLSKEELKKVAEKVEAPSLNLATIKSIYPNLKGNPFSRAAQMYFGFKNLKKMGIPVTKDGYYPYLYDYLENNYYKDIKGNLLSRRTATTGAQDINKNQLYGVVDNSGAEGVYVTKTDAPFNVLPNTYSGKLGGEGNLIIDNKTKEKLAKNVTNFTNAYKRIKEGSGKAEDLITMMHNFSSVENPTLMTQALRGTASYNTSLPSTGPFKMDRFRYKYNAIKDYSNFAKGKINYDSGLPEKFSLLDERNKQLFKGSADASGGKFDGYNTEVVRYVVDKNNVIELPALHDYKLDKYKDINARRALLKYVKPIKDKYPTLYEYLLNSKTVKTDGIFEKAHQDNKNVSIKFKIGDFGGYKYNNENPMELITTKRSVVLEQGGKIQGLKRIK